MTRWLQYLANLFPLWVLLGGVLALVHPPLFLWFNDRLIVWGLAVIMLGMGITLSIDDFRGIAKMPKAIAAGFGAQYAIMPFLGWMLASLFALPKAQAVGLILVACCPGGTASNVVTYIARGHVALSVLMTMCSTFGAIAFTPILTSMLAGQLVPVDGWGLFRSTLQVVLLPVIAGLALHHFAPRLVRVVLPISPLISVVTIALICASIIARNSEDITNSGGRLLMAVFCLHLAGFVLGYGFARLFGYEKIICRTVAIEVGMQNSGLGVVLARQHFTDPWTAVPGAISATFHSVIGSLFAAVWRVRMPKTAIGTVESDAEVPPSNKAGAEIEIA